MVESSPGRASLLLVNRHRMSVLITNPLSTVQLRYNSDSQPGGIAPLWAKMKFWGAIKPI